MQYLSFRDWLFLIYRVFKVHPYHNMCQNSLPFLQLENILCFLIYSPLNGHRGCFHLLAIVDNTAINMGVTDVYPSPHFQFFPEVELLDHRVFLLLFEVCHTVYIIAVPFYISTCSAEGSSVSTSSPKLLFLF